MSDPKPYATDRPTPSWALECPEVQRLHWCDHAGVRLGRTEWDVEYELRRLEGDERASAQALRRFAKDLDDTRAALAVCVEALGVVEWVPGECDEPGCAACGNLKEYGHASPCAVAAALERARKVGSRDG